MQQNTTPTNEREKILIEKIRTLSSEKVIQVADFVDFLSHKESENRLVRAGDKLAEPAFKKVWDNPEDDVYDNL